MKRIVLAVLAVCLVGTFVLAEKDTSTSVGFNESIWFGEEKIEEEDTVLSVKITPKRGTF